MHDILKFLSGIPDRTPGSGIFSCYVVDGTSIRASSRARGMTAGVPTPSPISFAVPAIEMDAALSRMKEVTELTIEDDTLIVRGGRLRTSIQLCADEAAQPPTLPEEWVKLRPGFVDLLKMALPFTGDRRWTQGIRLWAGKVTAISGAAGIDLDAPGLAIEPAALLPAEAASFLIEQDDPAQVALADGCLVCRWDNDRWLRVQLLNEEMPEDTIRAVFGKGGDLAPVLIDDDARAAYEDAAALSDGTVWVRRSGFEGKKGVARATVAHEMEALDEAHVSAWSVKNLDAVMKCATAWNPGSFPDISLFVGKGMRGLICGMSK